MYAQVNVGGSPISWLASPALQANLPFVTMPLINRTLLEEQDNLDVSNGLPPRFGFGHLVDFSIQNSGVWTTLPNGDRLWQLGIECPGALSINFTFSDYWLPQGATLYVYAHDRSQKIGGFTSANNKGDGSKKRGFATGLVFSSKVVLEYYEPKEISGQGRLQLAKVVHGYRHMRVSTASNKTDAFGDSGDCQVNINCAEGADWQDEKMGVALIIIDGDRQCTGSLVNNTSNNGALLFLTADHCLDVDGSDAVDDPNADDWSFIWDYEADACANPQNEPATPTTNGATVLANDANSDFALLLLDESPLALNPPVDIFFNGWSRTNNPGQGGVGIHHPSADIKKIATHNMVPVAGQVFNAQTHWRVNWIQSANGFSVTEGGSSGSPLFTNQSLIIGQLHGGSAINCNDPANDPGEYGRLDVSWNGNANTRRLRDWLDPLNLDVQDMVGGYFDACDANVEVDDPINNFALIQADVSIEASSAISNAAQVEMRAGSFIRLGPGFQVNGASFYYGHIQACESRVIPPANKTDEVKYQAEARDISIYPNPSTGVFTIIFNNRPSGKYIVTNAMGQQVMQQNCASQNCEVDLSNYPAGIYQVAIIFASEALIAKQIIIQR